MCRRYERKINECCSRHENSETERACRAHLRDAMEDAYESFVVKQFPRVPYVMPAAVQIIFDLAAARDPRAKTADPQGFIDMRFVRELEQSGAINQLYAQTR